MSSEIPCFVTDVGDSKIIVGDCGVVLKPNSVRELFKGIESLMQKDLIKLGKCSRQRIVEKFSIEKMVKKTEKEVIKCV